MPLLIALKPHRYNGKLWRKGQTFDASANDARVLITIGFAANALPQIHEPSANTDAMSAIFDRGPITGGEVPALACQDYPPLKRPRGRPRKSTYETRAMVAKSPAVSAAAVEAPDYPTATEETSEPTDE